MRGQNSCEPCEHQVYKKKMASQLQSVGAGQHPEGKFVEKSNEDMKHFFVGAIDQGTTSTRFLIFDGTGSPVAQHQIEFKQMYPHSGCVFSK